MRLGVEELSSEDQLAINQALLQNEQDEHPDCFQVLEKVHKKYRWLPSEIYQKLVYHCDMCTIIDNANSNRDEIKKAYEAHAQNLIFSSIHSHVAERLKDNKTLDNDSIDKDTQYQIWYCLNPEGE